MNPEARRNAYTIRRLAFLTGVIATAFVFGLIAREVFNSRPAGAVAFGLVIFASLPAIYWSAGRALPSARLRRLALMSVAGIVLVAAAIVIVPFPYGAVLGFLLFAPITYSWMQAVARGSWRE
jgi:hypothetical protein